MQHNSLLRGRDGFILLLFKYIFSPEFWDTINTFLCRWRLLTYIISASLTLSNQDVEQMRIYKLSIIFVPMELVAALKCQKMSRSEWISSFKVLKSNGSTLILFSLFFSYYCFFHWGLSNWCLEHTSINQMYLIM